MDVRRVANVNVVSSNLIAIAVPVEMPPVRQGSHQSGTLFIRVALRLR